MTVHIGANIIKRRPNPPWRWTVCLVCGERYITRARYTDVCLTCRRKAR